jgi:hypothetical protein
MGALAINQLLESSQIKGVEIALETAALEDQVILADVKASYYHFIMDFSSTCWTPLIK